MASKIQFRRDTSANWTATNPVLAQGEPGLETDTGKIKFGNGSTSWTNLEYYTASGNLSIIDDTIHGDAAVSLSSGLDNRENWILTVNANGGTIDNPDSAYNNGVAYDSLGNVYSIGVYDDNSGTFLQKISPSGEVLFSKRYDQYDSYGYGLTVDKDDNIITILSEHDGGDGSDDIVLVKVSSTNGSIVWQKNINSYSDSDDFATCVDTDLNGDIFIAGSSTDSGDSDCYIGKFSGVNGNAIWQKKYDVEGLDDTGTGVTVDKDGNLGVVGSSSWMGEFISVFKINGSTGAIMWEGRVSNIQWSNGSDVAGSLESTDICSDSNGDFYFGMTAFEGGPASAAMVVKFKGSTGVQMWARRVGWSELWSGSGSVICDDQDNVYLSSTTRKYKYNYDLDNDSYRATQQITKFNSTGGVVWQRWLGAEQAETSSTQSYSGFNKQSIRVQDNYVLVGGNYDAQNDYSDQSSSWNTLPYVAQLNRDGGEFEISGWSFKASDLPVEFLTISETYYGSTFDPATATDIATTVSAGDVNSSVNTDRTTLVYVNKSNVNKVTFEEKTLTLPAGGTLDVSREKLGYITAIGNFDGDEGSNNDGHVWLNGNDRDQAGATYSAGGWYSSNTWNDNNSYVDVPLVFKTDASGKLLWQAGNAVDQGSADLVDVVYHQPTNTVVALGNDGELDGNEGFNVMYLDADTGGMKANITHIRPDVGSNDIYPATLSLTANGTPVVSGYITSASATYANVTADGAGLSGSTNSGTLVIPKSVFNINGNIEYPKEDGTWYMYPDGSYIENVNRFGHVESSIHPTYIGTLGSSATVTFTVASGAISSPAVAVGGAGYKAGQRVKVLGTALNGTSPDNDLYLYIDTVGESGTITALVDAYSWDANAVVDATYTAVSTVAVAGSGLNGYVQYAPGDTTYTLFSRSSNGTYYGVGDTFKILGNVLGGVTPTNDLTLTVTSINGTGSDNGQVTGVTLSGTPQSANIKLYGGDYDYTATSSEINIRHELANDGFIWTPTWSKVFGTTSENDTYSYDDLHGLTIDSGGNVIVSGYSERTGLDSSYSSQDQTGVVMKFSSTGGLVWAKSLDGNEGDSTVWGVATDTDNNIYSVMNSGMNDDPTITKQDTNGNFVWQQYFNVNGSSAWAIDVADNGDVLIAGEASGDWFNNDYHRNNSNILVVKFDRDGNQLFARAIWSQNGIYTNNNDDYSNNLTIRGDRFSISAYSNDPGGDDNQGIVIDLPLDGTGLGDYGDFHYEEVEIDTNWRSVDNTDWNGSIVTDFTANVLIRPYTFVESPYDGVEGWRNVTVYADREQEIQTIYKPEGGKINGVANITFEDGSVQTTSMQGLPQVKLSQVNGGENDYWIRPEDNGKHIYRMWNDLTLIPSPDRVELPIGFAITIINGNNNSGVFSEGNSENIYLAGGEGDNDYSWSIPAYSMATLIKVEHGRWVIYGPGITSSWF